MYRSWVKVTTKPNSFSYFHLLCFICRK